MSVLLPNATLGVRRRVDATVRNAHGERVRTGWGPVVAVLPGRTHERVDGGWDLGLDPDLWPVAQGDLVVAEAGGSWLVDTANLLRNTYDSTVDWVKVSARQRSLGGTEPGGPWFVARYADAVDPVEPGDPEAPPVQAQSGLWTGYGPPTVDADGQPVQFGQQPGDEYMDLNTGVVYRFEG